MYNTPILLITFNRPQHTSIVLTEIKKKKPSKLFIFQDGVCKNRLEDVKKWKQVREIISKEVDWNCDLQTMYLSENLGCGYGPARAITWFFDNVEQGIILEDDCVPSESFFPFCDEMLNLYKHDNSIFMISGFNSLKSWKCNNSSYVRSLIGISLGWASWKRAWAYFDYNITDWGLKEKRDIILSNLGRKNYFQTFKKDFDYVYKNRPKDIWDTQWFFARLLNNGMTISPSYNLISNIGFDEEGTHTKNKNDLLANMKTSTLEKPFQKPLTDRAYLFEWVLFERFFNQTKRGLLKKIILKVIKILFKTH